MELTTVQATELSIRLGALLANHIFSLDSLEALDLTMAMNVLDGKVSVNQEEVHSLEQSLEDSERFEDDLCQIGEVLGDRYMDVWDMVNKIKAMQAKIRSLEGD